MKRSLAIIAVLALVVSMFSGVVFADSIACKIQLDQESINYSEDFATAKITGRILDASSNALRKFDNTIKVYEDTNQNGVLDADEHNDDDEDLLYSVDASNGRFELIILTSKHDVANMFVVGVNNDDATFAEGTEESFRIVREMEVASEYSLDHEYPISGQVVIQAVYTNEDGNTSDTVKLAYIKTNGSMGDEIATANFTGTDSVGFLFDGDELTHVGEIGLFINGVLMLDGEVSAPELDVEITDSIPHSLGEQDLKFTFNIDKDYIDEDNKNLKEGYELRYTITDSDDEVVVTETVLVDDDTETFDDIDDQEVTVTIDFDGWDDGDYTVNIQLVKVGVTVVAEADKNLDVVKPSRYTLMGWNLGDTLGNETIVLQFPDDEDSDLDDDSVAPNFEAPEEAEVDEQLEVREYSGGKINYVKYFTVEVTGCGVDLEAANFGDDMVTADGNGALLTTIKPETTGTLKIVIKAYEEEDGNAVDTFTKEIEITGWNMEISTKSIMVDSDQDVVFTITDEDGNPVNNAIISIEGEVVVDGTSTNIIGGVYTYKDDEEDLFETVDELDVVVKNKDGDVMIDKKDAINILGEEVYTVSTDTPVMLNGIEQKIYVTVLDKDGDIVYPEFVRVDVDEDGDETTAEEPEVGTRIDLDDDGIKEAIALTFTPSADQDELIIRATTDNGKKMGQVNIDVQMPKVVMTGAEKLTENFTVDFEFTVIDPRDDSIMDIDVEITEDSNYIPDDDLTFPTALSSDDDVWTAEVQVINVDWDEAEDEEDTVNLNIMMDDVKLATIEVAKASLTSEPEQVIIGAATNMILTYTDADGNVLEDYKIYLNEEEIGETDENGQVVYSTSSTNSLNLKFEGETDVEDKVTELTVKSTADTEGPVVTAPEEVTDSTAVITISDNVRVSKVMIDGKPVEIYFPTSEVTHMVTNLKAGENKFTVEALDVNNNYSKTVITITKKAPVSFQVNVPTPYGTPKLIDGTTMVPVRFAEDLGCVIMWDNTTKTATYTLGDLEIAVTVGSTTAVVNGENVQVTQTPYINELNRTMVPLRMIAQELGFQVHWTSNDEPVTISK